MEQITQKVSSIKINPFEGGLNNSNIIAKQEENIIDLSNIFGNVNNIKILTNYLDSFVIGGKNNYKAIIIRGNVGSGKMTLIKSCLQKLNYSSLIYDTDYESEDIYDNLLLSIEAKGITKLFQKKGIKKAIIIRDIDNSLRQTQRIDFFKFISMSKNNLPILMTSNNKTIGNYRDVPKCILQLEFENPSVSELIKFFWSDKISKNALEKTIIQSNFDLRYISNISKGFETSCKKTNIKKIANFEKDLELDTFDCIKFCYDSNNSIEKKLLNSSIYTNSTVFHNYPTIVKDIDTCSTIADLCTTSEELLSFSFENQCWELFDDTYNFIGTVAPLNIIKRKKYTIDNLTYPSSNITYFKEGDINFNTLEKDSILIKILVDKYFKENKFKGNLENFKNDIDEIHDPIKAFKLCFIINNSKNSLLFKEFKKIVSKKEDS